MIINLRLTSSPMNENILKDASQFQARLIQSLQLSEDIHKIKVGTTPKEIIYSQDGMVLYRYLPRKKTKRKHTPILIAYALVNRPYIVDLYEECSLVQGLLNQGLDVFLVDWGYPKQSDRYLDLPDYVDTKLHSCVEKTIEHTGAAKINLLGICQGGTMSLCYAANHLNKVRNLITMITPVDFQTPDNLLAHWFKNIDVDLLVDTTGNVPGLMLNSIFLSLKPFRLGIEKYLDLMKIIDQKEKVENFMRMEKWIFDSPDQAGEMFRTFLREFFQHNRLINGGLAINGKTVNLKNIKIPILNLLARQDHLVPPSSSQALKYLTGSDDYTEKIYDTGHIGIYVSSKAGKDIPTRISNWLKDR